MSRHRRHAEDFTNSLHSFRYTTSSDTLDSISQDSLDRLKSCNFPSNGPTRTNKNSTILAGSSTKDSLMLDTSISFVTSVETAPDLNKRINLFQSENLKGESVHNVAFTHLKDDNKENNDPQCAINRNIISKDINVLASTSSGKENRDTNYNIHCNKSNTVPISEQIVLKSWPILPNCTNEDLLISDSCEHEQNTTEINKFETILCSLDNRLNRIKEDSQTQPILKRLSEKFAHSPKNFTEKLVTIIEESVINNDDNTCNTSAINLSRLTTEFRKMCKFIEDESWPEWPSSLLSTPPSSEQILTNSLSNQIVHTNDYKRDKLLTTPPTTASLPATPLSATDIIKKRFFQKISKKTYNGSGDSLMNLSSNISSVESFERLEAQCKILFPEEKQYSSPLQRSFSVPSLLSMSELQNICDQQMAALSGSDTFHKEKYVASLPNLLEKCVNKFESDHKSTDPKFGNVSYSRKKSMQFNRQFDFNTVSTDEDTKDYIMFDTDELEKTLLQDIAEKRKRCLDTVRLITEINADAVVTEEENSLEIAPMLSILNKSNTLVSTEAKFIKTLMSCKDYLAYLETQKPLFNLIQSSDSCTPKTPQKNNKNPHIKDNEVRGSKAELLNIKSPNLMKNPLNRNVKAFDICKSPLSRKTDNKNQEKTEHFKPKLFVTPGRSSSKVNYKRKKEYFPSMGSLPQNTVKEHILKSPHAKGLYRLNYNTVVSPVGMYIRGTDMQLIKNVRAKTDGLLLTPVKKNVERSPSRISKQSTPRSGPTKSQKKVPLNINSSRRSGTNQIRNSEVILTPVDNSTPKSHFVLPKVSYRLPSRVKTIKETKSPKQGTRVKKLLESAHSKVVIRHEGRMKLVQKQEEDDGLTPNDEVLDIMYGPEDVSIHVEQAASKTNFIHRQKRI
ncbi:PREDICTED: uncharacterized protein LOC107185727 [Dufourea novaeangliae]|uniref:uncharacterized protein LOC107185727 n=1 Tax=Dufourea novaeangliae TaxID=178035 RepID=UPI000767C760|nr:PREDICTED: uncharacterized protein LOC107185727 [Dufourea novaeangliae]